MFLFLMTCNWQEAGWHVSLESFHLKTLDPKDCNWTPCGCRMTSTWSSCSKAHWEFSAPWLIIYYLYVCATFQDGTLFGKTLVLLRMKTVGFQGICFPQDVILSLHVIWNVSFSVIWDTLGLSPCSRPSAARALFCYPAYLCVVPALWPVGPHHRDGHLCSSNIPSLHNCCVLPSWTSNLPFFAVFHVD